jgi:hypothetical protein
MSGQLTICFSSPASPPASAPPAPPEAQNAPCERAAPALVPASTLPPPAVGTAELPALCLSAGYEMYRDETRTVIRRPGEARWGATVRTGPTTHRFVGGGPDPGALRSLAAREAGRAPAGTGRTCA